MDPIAPTISYSSRARLRTLLHDAIIAEQSLDDIRDIFTVQRCNLMDRDIKGRFPIHVAVKKNRVDLIEFLMPKPSDNPNAHKLDRKGTSLLDRSANKGTVACGTEIMRVAKELYPDNPYLNPTEGFIFAGGGAKGIAYAGGVRVLDRNNMLESCLRVAGTSAGAITATLIAVGCSAEQIEKIVTSTNGMEFFDLAKEALELGGVCKGQAFIDWLEDIIIAQTGLPHCTFGELAEKVRQDKSFKHLHVFACEKAFCTIWGDFARHFAHKMGMTDEGKVTRFDSESPKWLDLIISEAVRASMSLPLVYAAQILIYKDSDTNSKTYGKFYTEDTSVSFSDSYSDLKNKLSKIDSRQFLDGGIAPSFNYPLNAFDKGKYTDPGHLSSRKQIKVNPRVIGFKLSENPKKGRGDRRTIMVDTCGIGTGAFWTNSAEGSGKQAIEECDRVTQLYFDRKAAEVEGIIGKQIRPQINQNHNPLVYPTESESMALFFTNIHTHGGSFWSPLKTVGALAWGCFLPVTLLKITQCVVNSLSFQKSEMRKAFRALQYYNRGLKVFKYLDDGRAAKANDLFQAYKDFFNSSQVHRPLMEHLVYQNKESYIRYLEKRQIPVNVKSKGEFSLIHHALEMQCYDSFRALLRAANDCVAEELLDAEGNTVLHAIAKYGDLDAYYIVSACPEKFDALIHVKNASGETALDIAASTSRKIEKKLKAHIVTLSAKSTSSVASVTMTKKKIAPAIRPQQPRPTKICSSVTDQLDQAPVITNAAVEAPTVTRPKKIVGSSLQPPSSRVSSSSSADQPKRIPIKVSAVPARTMNHQNPVALVKSNSGQSKFDALCNAVEKWNPAVFTNLLNQNANVMFNNDTVLHVIAECGNIDAFEILKNLVPDKFSKLLNIKKMGGGTPLQIALGEGHRKIVEELLKEDVELRGLCGNGQTVLHNIIVKMPMLFDAFVLKANQELPSIIQQENGIVKSWHDTLISKTHDREILKVLMENGIDVHYTNDEGKHMLYDWAKYNDLTLATCFCRALKYYKRQKRLDILNHQSSSFKILFNVNKTPLIIAAQHDNHKIVKLLIKEGADCTSEVDEYTPLEYAKGKSKLILKKHIKTLAEQNK